MGEKCVGFHIVGDAFVDLFSFLEGDWPEKGGDAKLDQPIQTYAGGSSTNTTTHLNTLLRNFSSSTKSTDLVLHTILNPNDHFGKILLKHAEEQQFPLVNCKQENDDSATGHCVAIVAGQERSFMTYRGCVDNFDASHLDSEKIINSNCHVHLHIAGFFNLSGFQNGRITKQIQHIRRSRAEKFPGMATIVSLVPQHDATKQWDFGIDELTTCLDFVIMNDLEAMNIMQKGKIRRANELLDGAERDTVLTPYEDEEKLVEDCAIYFGKISPETCFVLTKGPAGAVALLDGIVVASQSTVKVKPVDPTGAGDSFAAGFLYGLWAWREQNQGQNGHNQLSFSDPGFSWPTEALKHALLWGCAMGTSSVLVRGASIPFSKDDIQRYYAAIEKIHS